MTTVGVIVPAYNSEPFIERALRSVLQQSHESWSCVVVDDGSPDRAGGIADDLARLDARLSVIHQDNQGVMAARNAGAAALPDVDALLFLDADDILLPEGLAALVAAMESVPQAAGAVGALRLIDVDDHVLDTIAVQDGTIDLEGMALRNPCPAPCGYLVRRSAFSAAGGFSTAYRYAGDWHLFILVARAGLLACTSTTVAGYRRHAGAVTASATENEHGHREIRHVRAAVYEAPGNTPLHRRHLRRAWRRYNWGRCRERTADRRPLVAALHLGPRAPRPSSRSQPAPFDGSAQGQLIRTASARRIVSGRGRPQCWHDDRTTSHGAVRFRTVRRRPDR